MILMIVRVLDHKAGLGLEQNRRFLIVKLEDGVFDPWTMIEGDEPFTGFSRKISQLHRGVSITCGGVLDNTEDDLVMIS